MGKGGGENVDVKQMWIYVMIYDFDLGMVFGMLMDL